MRTMGLGATLILLGGLTLGIADESIDKQIEELKTATTQERVELMNEFKKTLSALSNEDKMAAIDKLRSSMDLQSGVKPADAGSQYRLTNLTQVGSQDFMLKNSGESSNLCESGDFKYQRAK